jgi:hypothetical protein
MYYIGWHRSKTVPSRNSIGLAISNDNGFTFKRYSDGPILGIDAVDPYFVVAPCVIREKNKWKMWYTSGSEWKVIKGHPEIKYHIKYAESKNGILWQKPNFSCILPKDKYEVTARPFVAKEGNVYKCWYCYRKIKGFRIDKSRSYRIGYAESKDGINWKRMDKKAGIEVSKKGWDSQMIAYPALHIQKKKKYLFYNGNGFGKSGFGYAVLYKNDQEKKNE